MKTNTLALSPLHVCALQLSGFCAKGLLPRTKLGRKGGALKITFSESVAISSVTALSYVGKYGFCLFLPLEVKLVPCFVTSFT